VEFRFFDSDAAMHEAYGEFVIDQARAEKEA
jgi:hypothetical protein